MGALNEFLQTKGIYTLVMILFFLYFLCVRQMFGRLSA